MDEQSIIKKAISKVSLPFMRIFVIVCAWRAFNLLDKQCFDQIKKKSTESRNTMQNCKLFKKLLNYLTEIVLLKIELENNNEINTA